MSSVCLKLMAKREMAAAVISLQSPRDVNRSFVVLRPGQTETISSPQIVHHLIGFPSHSSYPLTLRANVISTAMPEAERD